MHPPFAPRVLAHSEILNRRAFDFNSGPIPRLRDVLANGGRAELESVGIDIECSESHSRGPKSRDLASDSIANSLALLCIAAVGEFPSAVALVLDWLRPIEHPDYVAHKLHESGLCTRFPETALRLLDAILNDQPWPPRELRQCLEAIAKAMPRLQEDRRYKRLAEYLRRRSLG